MESSAILVLALFSCWLIAGPIIALAKARRAESETSLLRDQIDLLQKQMRSLEKRLKDRDQHDEMMPIEERTLASDHVKGGIVPKQDTVFPESASHDFPKPQEAAKASSLVPPPLPPEKAIQSAPPSLPLTGLSMVQNESSEAAPPIEPFSLERFMGMKLFAWLGGVAMFFGVVLFVKYAFENNLVSPVARIVLGFVIGTGFLIGGLCLHRGFRYRVLAHAFCATGVLILYGVSFAAHAIYHFPWFGSLQTFSLMAAITVVAFVVAVRFNALVVAVLGMLGGFMTPILLASGRDEIWGLFGYIALLDIGLLALSRHARWRFLTPCAAVGTALMQIGWYGKFFEKGNYAANHAVLLPMGICLGFVGLFLVGSWLRRKRLNVQSASAVFILTGVATLFSFMLLSFESVANRYFWLYVFVFSVQLMGIITAFSRPKMAYSQSLIAILGFAHLSWWTSNFLNSDNLYSALGIYLVYGCMHAGLPLVLAKVLPCRESAPKDSHNPWYALVVLLLMAFPLFLLEPLPIGLWIGVLIANLVVITLGISRGAVVSVLGALGVTMTMAAVWLFRADSSEWQMMPFLGVISGFSLLYFCVSSRLAAIASTTSNRKAANRVPAVAAISTFLLLLMAMREIANPNPSAVFAVALMMSILLGIQSFIKQQGKLMLLALFGVAAVEAEWYGLYFDTNHAWLTLAWYIGFYIFFFILPFVFRKKCEETGELWITSALSGVPHFMLIYSVIRASFPNEMMGLIPAGFAIPTLAGLYMVLKFFKGMDAAQTSRLAWFGGVALLFITLIFPIQLERQWITISWAIEGALLLWLSRRVPHVGLQLTGLTLLAISFVRLVLNPAVFTEYERTGTAILNWHLYAFGLVATAHFIGARWFTDPANRFERMKMRGILNALGGILLFVLLNIEIADYFTPPGELYVAFQFGGNFARDTTYSIAWGLFSLALLGIGFWSDSKHVRYAAVGLLVATLLKVFLHDMAATQNIFRIGALIGVAVIAFIASFLYQRFFDKQKS